MLIPGKVFAVTGGGNGIGRDVVLALLAKGARVAAIDISEKGLNETVALAAAGDKLTIHRVDLTDRAAVEALPAAVIAAHGAVDGLLNVAGIIQPFVRMNDLPIADVERVMNVNFYGPLFITKAFLPLLLARPEAHIVAVSSMGGFLAVPGQTAYGASKAAMKLMFEGLYAELLDTKVGVSVVFPGAIATHIAANSGVTLAGMDPDKPSPIKMTPSPEAARQIVVAIEKNRYHTFIGKDSKMLDALTRLIPKQAARIISSQMRSLLPK